MSYQNGNESPDNQPGMSVDRFGGCPDCGSNDGYLNVKRAKIGVCHEHGTRWLVGENLFSTWRFENESDWKTNWELICRYRDVKPVYVELDLPTDRTPELIPEPVARSLPPLYGTEEEPDPIARVRLFMPNSTWSWYVTEYDHESKTGFGLVEGYEMDLQYFDLDELASIRGPRGERIERDLNFDPQRISDITLDQGIER